MLQVNIKQLLSAVEEVGAFELPEMSEGTEYLYNNLYKRLSQNMDVRLSEIDLSAFESEDIGSLNDLHSEVFVKNGRAAGGIMSALRETDPVCKAVGYV